MSADPVEAEAPPDSRVQSLLKGAHFHDAWCVRSEASDLSALEHYIAVVKRTPAWVNACMDWRNRAVALVGLKDLGRLSALAPDRPASDYQTGDRVGIFTLFENTFDEALLGDQDKHLDVHVSVHRCAIPEAQEVMLTVTTVVHVHGWLGRLYMLPVKPMHRLIVPTLLRAAVRSQQVAAPASPS